MALDQPALFDGSQIPLVLARHEPMWEAPAEKWHQGLPLGNGDLGAMLWGSGSPLFLTLDKTDAWELRSWQPEPSHFKWAEFRRSLEEDRLGDAERELSRPRHATGSLPADTPEPPYPTRLPIGRVELTPEGGGQGLEMRLRLHEATACGRIATDLGEVRFRAFVHATEPILVVDMQCEGEECPRPQVRLTREYSPEVEECFAAWGYPAAERGQSGEVRFVAQDLPQGGQYAIAWRATERRGRWRTLWVSVAYAAGERTAAEQAVATVQRFSACPVAELHAEHRKWWASFYRASFLSVPDTRLEGLYWVETYKIGSAMRPGRPPLALHGPWSQDGTMPPWSGDYHWNINVQMSYWPLYAANRLELAEPLYEMIDRARPRLREWCRRFFDREGEFLFHATDPNGEPVFDSASCQVEANGLAWVCHHYWLHWRYSQDTGFLRERAFPLMKEAVRPLLELLEPGADGMLHLPWGSSPEYAGRAGKAWGPDPTCDLALIRFLCGALLEARAVLGTEDPERARWAETLECLAPYPEDAGGLKVRADLGLETSHRHHSHLMPLHPLHLLTWEQNRELVERSLRRWSFAGHGEWVGFSLVWGASLAAHAGRPALARSLLLDYCDRWVSENTFHLQGPIGGCDLSVHGNYALTLEAGCGAANALQEMLLQSHGGVIRIFPAAPEAWQDAAFWGLRAEGGFVVSAVRRGGATLWAHVRSLGRARCRILPGFASGPVHFQNNGTLGRLEGGAEVQFDMAPTEEVLLWAGEERPDIRVLPVPPRDHERNFFGVKRVPRW